LADYTFSIEHHRAVSRSISQTCVVALMGILASLFLGYLCPDARGPVNVFLPFVLIALYVLMEFQGVELASRELYLALLEMRIRSLTGSKIPCWESGFRRIIYRTWRFEWLKLVVAAPVLLLYIICIWKGMRYLMEWHYLLSIFMLIAYILAPLFAILVASGYHSEIEEEVARLEKEFSLDRHSERS
jgi:hypothetical protein